MSGSSSLPLCAALPWLLLTSWAVAGCSAGESDEAGPPPFFGTPAGGLAPPTASDAANASRAPATTAPVTAAPTTTNGAGNAAGSAGTGAGGAASTAPAAAAGSAGNAAGANPEAPVVPALNPGDPSPPAGASAPAPPEPSVPTPGGGGAAPAPPGGRFGLGGASRCGGGAFVVCESFEAAALGPSAPAGWSFAGYGNRTLGVVDDDSARGDRALRVDVSANQGAVVGMLARANLGALGQRHFGRSFLKIAVPAPTGFVHFDAFEARGDFNGQANLVRWASTGTNVGTGSNNWSWIYNVQSTDHGEFGSEGPRSAHPREGDWMCLEWSMDAGAQEARFWFDSVEVDYLHIDTERAEIPVFDTFNIGFQKFQQSGAWSVWVDEVAFDDQRIGCDG